MIDLYPTVDKALNAPGKCIVSSDIDGPFLDLGGRSGEIDPYMYIHVPVAEKIGRSVGMVPKSEVDEIREKVAELQTKLDELTKIKDALDTIDAAEKTLEEATA